MQYLTDNTRITGLLEVSPPNDVISEFPITPPVSELVFKSRQNISDIIHGKDDRLVVVVGPCSIHDPKAAIEYAKKLKNLESSLSSELKIVMRVYFEKPRTTVGWKGLINDPNLDDSYDVNKGLREARKILLDIKWHRAGFRPSFLVDKKTADFVIDKFVFEVKNISKNTKFKKIYF